MPQDSWPSRLTLFIAGEIRRRREEQHISAQQLAEACTDFGLSISRATLTDLENGRRAALSIAELHVIAKALKIHPLQLIAPLDRGRPEVLPDEDMDPWSARRWIIGEGETEMKVLHDYVAHEQQLHADAATYARGKREPHGPAPWQVAAAKRAFTNWNQKRGTMLNDGWELPDIPEELQKLLAENPEIADAE